MLIRGRIHEMAYLGCLLAALAPPSMAQQPFAWKDTGSGMELQERGKVALTYNYGQLLKAGAPENRRRCCYIFPVYTPAGVSMLDDFPPDHPHHRGLFWSWPVVEIGGRTYDQWMNMTVKAVTAKPPVIAASAKEATLHADNRWQLDGHDVMNEQISLTVSPTRGNSRELQVELTLEALGGPITLRGSREAAKSYGGFSARFAAREGTILRADGETLTKDEDLNPRKWAELEGVYGGRKVILRITPDASDTGAPYQWCLRNYGFVGASFPGKTPSSDGYTLEPGKPLKLKFRVSVTDAN